jgi:hypothetical protein
MERRFGRDFSEVRVHTDAGAASATASRGAAASTLGHEVSFAAGRYAPNTEGGRALLAHELAHVAQIDNAATRPDATASSVGELEREATDVAFAQRQLRPLPLIQGIARVAHPLMAPPTPGGQGDAPTYGSLSPRTPGSDYVKETVELKKVGGSWVEVSVEGASKPANGTYSFALRDGRMYGSRYGHLEASGGGRVRFAGDIQFSNGRLERWDAGSGSYKPVESFVEEIANEAKKAGLVLEYDKDPQKSKFRPIEGKTGQRQLPMHQEPKDSKLSKGPSSRGPAQGTAGGASGPPSGGAGMRPPLSKPEGSVTPAMRAGARDMVKELGKNLKIMRAARILTTVTRVIEFAGTLVMAYQSVSMAQHSLAGEGFILTERIKQSESLRDQANDLKSEYPAFSDWVQSNGFPIYIAAVDPDSIEQLV